MRETKELFPWRASTSDVSRLSHKVSSASLTQGHVVLNTLLYVHSDTHRYTHMHNQEGSKDRKNITNDRSRLDTQDPLTANPLLPGKL